MALQESFLKAVEESKVLKVKPGKEELTELYGLYKQSTVGDVDHERPGILNFVGRVKWDAWIVQNGMTKEEAMAAYVAAVEKLKEKYGI